MRSMPPPVPTMKPPGCCAVTDTLLGAMLEILRRVEDSDRLMVIEEFSFTFVKGVPNMSMTLVAYYRVGSPAPQEARNGVL